MKSVYVQNINIKPITGRYKGKNCKVKGLTRPFSAKENEKHTHIQEIQHRKLKFELNELKPGSSGRVSSLYPISGTRRVTW